MKNCVIHSAEVCVVKQAYGSLLRFRSNTEDSVLAYVSQASSDFQHIINNEEYKSDCK